MIALPRSGMPLWQRHFLRQADDDGRDGCDGR